MKTMLANKKILSVCTTAVIAIVMFAQIAIAATIDFEDLTLGTEYNVGDTFTSAGVQITGESFFSFPSGPVVISGSAAVSNGALAGGAGLGFWINNINLSFDFGAPLDGLALQYGEFGGNINLDINGTLVNVENFANIPLTVAGTSVFTLDTGTGTGSLFIIGNINSFAIGGQELAIDNIVASVVPEPVTITMLGFGVLLALKRKKRTR